jgi:hypothetical protein
VTLIRRRQTVNLKRRPRSQGSPLHRHILATVCLGTVLVVASAGAAFAYFSGSGVGSGQEHVGSLASPGGIEVDTEGSNATITWNAVVPPSTGAVAYEVTRSGTSGAEVCGFPTPVPALSCIDALSPGTYTYTVTALWQSWTSNATSGTVYIGNQPVVSPDSGSAGSSASISGTGFPSDTSLSATFGSTPVTLSVPETDAAGDFSEATFAVPTDSADSTAGNHVLTVTAGATSSAVDFMITPQLLTIGDTVGGATSGPPGTLVGVSGNGFAPDVASGLTVIFGGTSYTLSGSTDATGTLSSGAGFAVPAVPDVPGGYTLSISDGSNTSPVAATNYTVTPQLLTIGDTVGSATSGPPGTLVSVSGNGFTPDVTSGLTVIFGGTSYTLSGSTDATGTLSSGAGFSVPNVVALSGGYTVAVSDGMNTSSDATSNYTVT